MQCKLPYLYIFTAVVSLFVASSCAGGADKEKVDSAQLAKDSVEKAHQDSISEWLEKFPGDTLQHTATYDEIIEYINSRDDADKYAGGIIYVAAENAPEYAARLLNSKYDKFIVVDKASMNVILYDKYGHQLKKYGMACARNYGTKHRKADSRTPEGFFSVEGKYNSTDWLFTDDNGVTHPGKGAFGPRFIRLKVPNTTQIGIHGTSSPRSIGKRASHGCIRLLNQNILELVDLVEVGMPVIVLPGKRDREVNRNEGYAIAYFPTGEQFKMSDAEKDAKVNPNKKDFSVIESNRAAADSIAVEPDASSAPEFKEVPTPSAPVDSIAR